MRSALLHGFAGTPAAWNDVIAAWQLPEAPRAIALPGHGGGDVRPTWDDNVAAVAAQLAGIDVVIGYSLGARIALGLIASGAAPRAVLVGVNPGIDDSERAARRASDADWARMLRERGIAAFEHAWTAQPLFASQRRLPEESLAVRRAARLALDPEQLARSLEIMGLGEMADYRPQVPALRDRITLIVGAEDEKFFAIARTMPLGVELVAGSGHDPSLEQPERLAACIARGVVRVA